MDIDHSRCAELIPWYVNGTLAPDERAQVERHLGQCVPCRTILHEERRTLTLMRKQDDVPLKPEHGIVDLLQKIDAAPRRAGAASPAPARLRPVLLGTGLAAASLVVIGLIVILTPRETIDVTSPGSFSTLSSDPATARERIDLILADNVDGAQLQELLAEIEGTIVSGPTAIGRYTISLAPGQRSEQNLPAVLEELRRDPRVRFAGPSFIETELPIEGNE